MTHHSGTLFIVATPIGNLEDITLRALRILQEVDVVLSEDTRVTSKLFSHHGIHTTLERHDSHTSDQSLQSILERLQSGVSFALVSDAGTPTISDPGFRLVQRARLADIRIEPIPGASALLASLSASGVSSHPFTFGGFLPHKKGRQTQLSFYTSLHHTVVLYESVHRILKLLNELDAICPERTLTVCRELTKLHESWYTGTPKTILALLESQDAVRGEFVVILHPDS